MSSPYYEDEWYDDEMSMDDCSLMPNGHCLAAGSEDCDVFCPYSRLIGSGVETEEVLTLIYAEMFLHRANNGQLFLSEVCGYVGEDVEAGAQMSEQRCSLREVLPEMKPKLVDLAVLLRPGESLNLGDFMFELVPSPLWVQSSSVDDIPF